MEIVHLFRVVLEIVVVLASLVKRPVAGGAKHLRQRFHPLGQADVIKDWAKVFAAEHSTTASVIVDAKARLHRPGDDRRARCRADASWSVKTVEANTAFRELVDVGRLDDLIAVTTKPAADVLEVNPKYVWSFRRLRLAKQAKNSEK